MSGSELDDLVDDQLSLAISSRDGFHEDTELQDEDTDPENEDEED